MTSFLNKKGPQTSDGQAAHDATAAAPESQMPAQSSRRPRQPSKPDIPMPIALSFQVEGAQSEPTTGFIAALSLVGVDIETFEAPPIGSLLVMRAALDPNADPLTIRGRVQWVNGSRVGIQFAALGAHDTHVILGAMRR